MRKIFLFLFLGILFCSCEKQQTFNRIACNVPVNGTNTKTHLEPDPINRLFDVIWDANDQVMVYDINGGRGIYTNLNEYEDDNNEVAYFGGEGVSMSSTVRAFYPISIAKSSNTFTLPYEQMYRPIYTRSDGTKYGYMNDYPMWGQETGNNHIWFRNLTGIMLLRIRGKQGVVIRRIYVKDPSDPHGNGLRGDYSVSASGSTHVNEPDVTCVNPLYDITLNCNSNPQTLVNNQSTLFYLSVPEGVHRWLLVGLEYKMPGESVWNTTYQSIYAQTYNEVYFDFERSKWSNVDVDFSGLDGSLLYSVNNITLKPRFSNDTVINTGIPLINDFVDYTFTIDITPEDIATLDNVNYIRKTIYSEMDVASSSWKGIIIRLGRQNNIGNIKLEVAIGSSVSVWSGITLTRGNRYKFVVTLHPTSTTRGTATLYYKNGTRVQNQSATYQKTNWASPNKPEPHIGGDQHINGRYFDGTIHTFKIYNRLFNTTEINNFLNS